MCVKSVDYYLILNNELVCHVIRGKGLARGDPLFSYLFVMC